MWWQNALGKRASAVTAGRIAGQNSPLALPQDPYKRDVRQGQIKPQCEPAYEDRPSTHRGCSRRHIRFTLIPAVLNPPHEYTTINTFLHSFFAPDFMHLFWRSTKHEVRTVGCNSVLDPRFKPYPGPGYMFQPGRHGDDIHFTNTLQLDQSIHALLRLRRNLLVKWTMPRPGTHLSWRWLSCAHSIEGKTYRLTRRPGPFLDIVG
jgi:hypothetical protein